MFKKKKKDTQLTPWAAYQANQAKSKKSWRDIIRIHQAGNGHTPQKNVKENSNSNTNSVMSRLTANVKEFKLGRISWIVIGSISLILVLVGVFLLTPISRIQKVTVSGNKRVDSAQIVQKSNLEKNQFIFNLGLKKADIQKRVKKSNSDLKTVVVQKQKHNAVNIKVTENAVMGFVIRNGKYYTIRQDGNVIAVHNTQPNGKFPVFRDFTNDSQIKDFLSKYSTLPNEVQDSISEVDFAPTKITPTKLKFYMDDGNQVLAVMRTFATKMKYYPGISASMKKKGIVDLEVGAFSYPYSMESEENELGATNVIDKGNTKNQIDSGLAKKKTKAKPKTNELKKTKKKTKKENDLAPTN